MVISDNFELTNFFKEKVKILKTSSLIDYRYTIINKDPEKLKSIGAKAIDMKNAEHIEKIIHYYDILFSLHCKQIFPTNLVNNKPCINLHPGLNPYNRGWFPQVFSIINKFPIGATLHLMDEMVDHGEVIDQKEVQLNETDTSYDLYRKVIEAEKEVLSNNLNEILNNNINSKPMTNQGNYNSISDFKKLCSLDMEHKGTLREHLDLLRALTHRGFDNAYFYSEGNKRVYVKIELNKEI